MRSRSSLFGVTDLLLLFTVCIWAVNFIVIKNVIGGALQPIAFTALRFVVASLGAAAAAARPDARRTSGDRE